MILAADKKILRRGYRQAQAISKQHGRTFYFASRFLPLEPRQATHAVYAFCRYCDDTADHPLANLDKIQYLQDKLNSLYAQPQAISPLSACFKETVDKFSIPKDFFDELISGMRMDMHKKRYATFDELYGYCYKVAGVIGLIMLKIYRCNDSTVTEPAVQLGIAMQLTNILRDIKEDFELGRIYIPQQELSAFSVSENDIAGNKVTPSFKELMSFQISRARHYYATARKGIQAMGSRRTRFVALTMLTLYAAILDEIEENKYDIFSRRAFVNTRKKMNYVLKILLKGEYR